MAEDKIPGICYVDAENGIQLPVLDITHQLFASSIQEESLAELCKGSALTAQGMKDMPQMQKQLIYENSLIFGKHFVTDPTATYLSGMATYVLKLGPHLLGGGDNRKIDRMISMGVSSISARMRLRDICCLQADYLINQLKESDKNLRFINLAGGSASDSINTLILILQRHPSLLQNRQIRIQLLEIDPQCSIFAGKCIETLKQPGCRFYGLDVELKHIPYNWMQAAELNKVLGNRGDSVFCCSSEGGLFEYGSDEDIIENLDALDHYSPPDMPIVGSMFHEIDKVDPTLPAMAETSGASMRFLGIEAISGILDKTNWQLDVIMEANPCYAVFTLKRR